MIVLLLNEYTRIVLMSYSKRHWPAETLLRINRITREDNVSHLIRDDDAADADSAGVELGCVCQQLQLQPQQRQRRTP